MTPSVRGKCDNCIKKQKLRAFKGKLLCYACCRKQMTYFGSRRPVITLDQALTKVYEVLPVITNKGLGLLGVANFPRVMVGRKFNLILVEEKENAS